MGIKVTFHKKITINGREVGNSSDASPNRPALEDPGGFHVSTTRKIIVNGREYASEAELPEELREMYRAGLARRAKPGFLRTLIGGVVLIGVAAVVLVLGLGLLAVALALGLAVTALVLLFGKRR